MKLLSLSIHNLASIADVVIDFDSEPLNDAAVFLISGDTGSGKSTILDAICLALYNRVPRMVSVSVKKGDAGQDEEESKPNEPFQLLRKGTAETLIMLRFLGLEDKEYEAHWGIYRANKKPGGKLQKQKMDLTLACIERDKEGNELCREEIKRNLSNIEKVTENVIGLTYSQFCRTTLLAQGEFTTFLKSDGEEKSNILAKVTDRRDFIEIGKEIHTITAEKKERADDLRKSVEAVALLDDIQLAELNARLETVRNGIASLKKEETVVEGARKWFDTEGILRARTDTCRLQVSQLSERTSSEEFLARKKDSDDWYATIPQRLELRQRDKARGHVRDTENTLVSLQDRYAQLLGSGKQLAEHRARTADELRRTDAVLSRWETRRELMENRENVVSSLDAVTSFLRQSRNKAAEAEESRKRLPGLRAALTEAEEKAAIAEKGKKEIETAIETLEGHLREKHLDDVASKIAKLGKRSATLEGLGREIRTVFDGRSSLENMTAELESLRKEMASEEGLLRKLRGEAGVLEAKVESAKELEERLRLTVSATTEKLRSLLTPGCTCPVCSQKVENVIAFNTAESNQQMREAETGRKQIEEDLRAKNSEIGEYAGKQKSDARRLKEKGEALEKARKELDSITATLREKLATERDDRFGITAEGLTAIVAARAQCDAETKVLQQREEEARPMRVELENKRKELKKAEKAVETANAARDSRRLGIEKEATLYSSLKTDYERLRESAENLFAELCGSEEFGSWPPLRIDGIPRFRDFFISACRRVSDAEAAKKELTATSGRLDKLMEEIASLQKRVEDLLPAWRGTYPGNSDAVDIDTLSSDLSAFLVEVEKTTGRLKELTEEEKLHRESLEVFFASESGIDEARLEALDRVGHEEADREKQALDGLVSELKAKRRELAEAEKDLKAHALKRPELEEGQGKEWLDSERERLGEEREKLSREEGEITAGLNADAENRSKVGALREQYEEAQADYDMWSRLDRELGSATGDKFNRIAQSYILADLLRRANRHLEKLTDRYRLVGVPGSYRIDIIDNQQGGARRSAHTSSGGESFLISLSMALALGDMGRGLGVDPLFIDEGFGTLSDEPLRRAIGLLETLRDTIGRRVGVISHVKELRETIPVQLRLTPNPDTGASEIIV